MEENPYKAPATDGEKQKKPSTAVKRPWCLGIGTLLGASLGVGAANAVTYHPSVQPLTIAFAHIVLGLLGAVMLGAVGLVIDIARGLLKPPA